MDNEVIIHVRVKKDDVKAGFEAIGRESVSQSKRISDDFSKTFSETFTQNVSTRLRDSRGRFVSAGRDIGDTLGDSISQRVTERVTTRLRDSRDRFVSAAGGNGGDGGRGRAGGDGGRGGDANVSVDVDKQSLISRFFQGGKEAAIKFSDGFKDAWGNITSGIFSGDVASAIIKGIAVGTLAVLLAPVLGAAISSAILLGLGGGVLAAGIAGAFKDPIVLGAAKGTLDNLKADLADFGKAFAEPIVQFFVRFQELIGSMRPQLKELSDAFAPVLTALGNGFIGLLQNALPGILRAAEGAKPLFETLADKLPMLGDSIGRFFDHINDSAPDAELFLGDMLELVGLIIRAFGTLVEMLTIAYRDIRLVLAGVISGLADVLRAAALAFMWVPGLGPKLREASNKVDAFSNKFNESFNKIHKDIKVNVRINVVGLSAARAAIDLAAKLSKMGYAHGGVVGAATGGMHGGLRMVGEHGPELVDLPPGTQVHSNPDTERMMGSGGGSLPPIVVQLVADARLLAEVLVEPTRELVRTLGQGSVQGYLGQPGVA